MTDNKPAPTVIGVSGFNAFGTNEKKQSIDWQRLFGLPPFEMYLAEKTGNNDSKAWADWLASELARKNDDDVFFDYAVWHGQKGYWANETPFGELK